MSTLVTNGPIGVAGVGEDVSVLGTLAGLPDSFAIGASEDAPVRSVVGDGDWSRAVMDAINQGAQVVVVTDPGPCDGIDEVASAADGRAHVVFAEGWTGDPALTGAVAAWPDALAAGTFVELDLLADAGMPLDRALLAAIRLLRAVGRPLPGPECVIGSADGVAVVARQGGSTWSVLVSRTRGPSRSRISVSDKFLQIAIELSDPGTAGPGLARLIDPTSELRLDARFESGYRPGWLQAHHLVGTAATEPQALRELATDVRAVRAILNTIETRHERQHDNDR